MGGGLVPKGHHIFEVWEPGTDPHGNDKVTVGVERLRKKFPRVIEECLQKQDDVKKTKVGVRDMEAVNCMKDCVLEGHGVKNWSDLKLRSGQLVGGLVVTH